MAESDRILHETGMMVEFGYGTERVACGCRVYRDDTQARGIEFCSTHRLGFNILSPDQSSARNHKERLDAVREAFRSADACRSVSDQNTVQLPTDSWMMLAHSIRELVG